MLGLIVGSGVEGHNDGLDVGSCEEGEIVGNADEGDPVGFPVGILVGLEVPLLMRILREHLAFEELVAEQISARICYELGLPADLHESHASYIGHWLDILKSDKSAIITAAAKADQAFNYLAAFSGYDSEAEEKGHETATLQAYA